MRPLSRPGKGLSQFGGTFARILFGGLLGCAVAAAQPSYRPQDQFDHWTTDDGLPQNAVNAILQTRNGYLWLATFDGLVRFDGMQFTVFNKSNTKGIGANRFDTLFEDRRGVLWAVTEDSWLVKYQAGVFTTYTPKQGLPSWTVVQIEEDGAGDFQIVSREGIVKWEDGRFITYPLKDLPPASAGARWVKGNRLAWLAGGKLCWYAHGRLNSYSTFLRLQSPPTLDRAVQCISRPGWFFRRRSLGHSSRPGGAFLVRHEQRSHQVRRWPLHSLCHG